jgi:hypothetical protein
MEGGGTGQLSEFFRDTCDHTVIHVCASRFHFAMMLIIR